VVRGFRNRSQVALGIRRGQCTGRQISFGYRCKITTQYAGTPYEVTLPRVPWLREQRYINDQSIQPVKFSELTRKAPGQFDARVLADVRNALRRWQLV
jgi:hypothetical protein